MTNPPVLFECKKHHMRQTESGWVISFVVHPDDDVPHWFSKAKLGTPMSVTAELIDYDNPDPPKRKEPREQTPSQHCATWCKNPEFQEWLGIDITDARATPSNSADILVKNQLGITSKTELDINPEAAERWRALHSEFLYRDFLR